MPGVTSDVGQQPEPNVPQPGGLEVAAFCGLRYASAGLPDLGPVLAPPYDLIDSTSARRLRARHPHNVVRLIRPEAGDDQDRYQSAGRTLHRWLAGRVLAADPQPALYVYEERSQVHTIRGLLATVRLARAETGIIQPHEETSYEPIADRVRLMHATEANLEPVLLLYQGQQRGRQPASTASALIEDVATSAQPVSTATAAAPGEEGVAHRLWSVTDPGWHAEVARDLFGRSALIADGHHRYTAYLRVQAEQHARGRGAGPWDYGLAMLVDSCTHPPQLDALHRVLPRLPPHDAVAAARRAFRVTPLGIDDSAVRDALQRASRRGPAFLLAGGNGNYLVTDPDPELLHRSLPPGRTARWAELSTAVLHHLLIPQVWGVSEHEGAVLTLHDPAAARRAAERNGGTAVLMHPLQVDDVRAVAQAGDRMPPKSTAFGPKPPTGLVLRSLDAGPVGLRLPQEFR